MAHVQQAASSSVIGLQADVENERLRNKIHLTAQSIGLLPGLPSDEKEKLRNILEVGCGPGTWVLEVAKDNVQVIGIDTREYAIMYAKAVSKQMKRNNVQFHTVADLSGPFPFPDQSFDLLSAQNISLFFYRYSWPRFLTECFRLLRPGGRLRLTEFEMGMSNAPAHEEFVSLFLQAMSQGERSLSITGRHLGTFSQLESLLLQAGFHGITVVEQSINYSTTAPLDSYNFEWQKDYQLLARGAMFYIVSKGVATQERVEALLRQQEQEMKYPWFSATLPIKTFWGIK